LSDKHARAQDNKNKTKLVYLLGPCTQKKPTTKSGMPDKSYLAKSSHKKNLTSVARNQFVGTEYWLGTLYQDFVRLNKKRAAARGADYRFFDIFFGARSYQIHV
jgi:hypothetical protein